MNTYKTVFLVTAFSGLLFSGCTKQNGIMPNEETICLSASIGELSSRAENEQIQNGTYYFTYNTNSGKKVCITKFESGIGYPLVKADDNADAYQFLKWNDVAANDAKKYEFTLDNVENNETCGTISLNDKAYQAAPITEENSYLDIVYGKTVVNKAGTNINMQLSHKMSKISLEIYVKSNINLKDNDVIITLKNVINQPEKFDRTNGTVSVAQNPVWSAIKLFEGRLQQDGDKYTISSWIFPPQQFNQDNWPELEIKVGNTTYAGKLTHYMIDGDENSGKPIDMSGFIAGRHLTLRANLSENVGDVELIFMPVWVKKWEDVGTIGIISKQRGIYTEKDYEALVGAYNADSKDEAVLLKYGTKNETDDKWQFTLYQNVGNEGENFIKFKDDDFDINFNGYKIYGKTVKTDLVDDTSNTDGN